MTRLTLSQRLVLTLIMLVSAALTVPQLGLRSFCFFLAFSWWLTTVNLADLWQVAWHHEELNMVLYAALLNVWSRWGESEFWLRLPSAFFAVGSVWAVARLGSILFEPRVGLTAASLMALNGFVVLYAQEARAYSMLLFLATLSSYLLVCALKQGVWRYWCGFIVASVLCGYAHFLGVLQVFSQMLVAASLVYFASGRVPARLLFAASFILLGILPLLWFVLTKRGGIDWIPEPTLGTLVPILKNLVGGGVMLLAFLPLVAFGFARRFRDEVRVAGGGSFSPAAYVVLCFAVPLLLVFAVSLVRPLTVPRYLIAIVAPLVLAAALGLMAIPHRALRLVALVAVMALALRSAVGQLTRETGDDYRSATAYVLEGYAPGDALMFCRPQAKMGFDYYARDATLVPPTLYPRYGRPYGEPVFGAPGALSADDLEGLAARFDRVSMICTHDPKGRYAAPLLAVLGKDLVVSEERGFPYVQVLRLQKRD